MKQIVLKQNNYTELFNKNNTEPTLVKNPNNDYFLVLPLKQMNWQRIFYHLYQLPSEIIEQKQEKKTDLSAIDRLCGSMKGSLSSSYEFAKNKQIEKELEERKWKK